jgi:microcystin-dependent protein
MANPFMGEMRIMAFNFAPQGWAMCNGQFLPINQNQALFSLLGTMYGGNGQTTFALPDMRGRVPISSNGQYTNGERGGQEVHTLTISEYPAHTHIAQGSTTTGTVRGPDNAIWAQQSGILAYTTNLSQNLAGMMGGSVSNAGGSQPHNNMSPYIVLNICIALIGIFPSQN